MVSLLSSYFLAALLVLLAALGPLLNVPSRDLFQPVLNQCRNQVLWHDQGVESYSCPLANLQQTLVTFTNPDSLGPGRDLVLFVVAKMFTVTPDIHSNIRIVMDAVIHQLDKKTHVLQAKHFINGSYGHLGYFSGSDTVSSSLEILRVPLSPDSYYQLQVFDLRSYNCWKANSLGSDRYAMGTQLINAFMWPSIVNKETHLLQYQYPVFLLTLVSSLVYFACLLSTPGKLLSLRSALATLFSLSVLAYSCPSPWIEAYCPSLRQLLPFGQAYLFSLFLAHFTVSVSLNYLPTPVNHILWFVTLYIDLNIAGYRSLAITDTLSLTRTDKSDRYREGDSKHFEQEYSQKYVKAKFIIISLIMAYLTICSRTLHPRVRAVLPVIIVLALWTVLTGLQILPFKHFEQVRSKLHLDMAYLPWAVMLQQYLSWFHTRPALPFLDSPSVTTELATKPSNSVDAEDTKPLKSTT